MQEIDQYLSQNHDRFEQELIDFLRIPSVSAKSQHQPDMAKAADWVLRQFQDCGLETELIQTAGHPIVYAQWLKAENAPTVLIYGHYDVQPPEPLEEWITPPFEPTVRDGNVYARGATDDKGQMLTHVKGVEAWLKTLGHLPVNVKFLIEGEEEVGSENLYEFIKSNQERLACDVAVISDTSQFSRGQPAITYGLKGLAYFELRLTGPKQDLHSGTFGGSVKNPANALTEMLSALVNDQGQVQIPGFYDDVQPLEQRERDQFAALPFTDEAFKQQLGIEAVFGEAGYTTLERRWARPTFDINGLWSGYQGEGAKTVLPAQAGAKFSFRLVPSQDPQKIAAALKAKLQELCPPGIRMQLEQFAGSPGVVVPLECSYMTAAAQAIEQGFGVPPVFIREGGSIPVVLTFRQLLGVDTLLLGWGLDDDNTHSPNEKFSLADFHRGIKSSAYLLHELGKMQSQS